MKHLTTAFLLACLIASPAFAITHDELMRALDQGDYKTLLDVLRNQAEESKTQMNQELKEMDPSIPPIQGDAMQAYDSFFRSMRRADPYAMSDMGTRYAQGIGVRPDPVLAYAWFTLALDFSPNPRVQSLRDDLAKNMTPEQIQAAETVAETLKNAVPAGE